MNNTLYSFFGIFLLYASNLFRFFAHAFSARATVITHTATDWLFSSCFAEHQDKYQLFERVAIGYSKYKYAVSIYRLLKQILHILKISFYGPNVTFM